MSLTATEFLSDNALEYTNGVAITSENLNDIQKGILYNNIKISKLEKLIATLSDKIDSSQIILSNIEIDTTAWKDSEFYKRYPYQADISLPSVTSDMVPSIIFPQNMIDDLVMAPTCDSYNGGIRLYAMNKAIKNYTISKIILWKS